MPPAADGPGIWSEDDLSTTATASTMQFIADLLAEAELEINAQALAQVQAMGQVQTTGQLEAVAQVGSAVPIAVVAAELPLVLAEVPRPPGTINSTYVQTHADTWFRIMFYARDNLVERMFRQYHGAWYSSSRRYLQGAGNALFEASETYMGYVAVAAVAGLHFPQPKPCQSGAIYQRHILTFSRPCQSSQPGRMNSSA